jgi:membrane-associated phospholipid phosphatase
MFELIQRTKIFAIPFFILVGGSTIFLLFFDKIEIALWINANNNGFLDIFFSWFTNLGDGIAAIIISLIFLLLNIRKGLILLTSFLLSGSIIQILKIFVFPDILRPIALIGHSSAIHLVEGVAIWDMQSFPSGHSGTAFALFYCLSAFTDNYRIQLMGLLAAILVAYSRMYLFQHFLPDVVAGAVIGTFTSLALLTLFEKFNVLDKLNHSVFPTKRTHAEKIN